MRRASMGPPPCRTFPCRISAYVLVLVAVLGTRAAGQNDAPREEFPDLTSFSLEELMEVEITSVRKRSEPFIDAAAALYVITGEDIRRSGVRSIPEALRMVPGVQVARIDANKWAISARGFNSRFANKLLVLIDGRSVYTPLFSGVYWELQDTLLEDIERIEVIRGPGGTLWGANAVNGVINIITRNARDTQGGLGLAGAGTEELGTAASRWGGRIGEEAFYRVYGKYFFRDDFVDDDGDRTDDDWEGVRGGFRVDWEPSEKDSVTFEGDVYYQRAGRELLLQRLTGPPFEFAAEENSFRYGGNVLARWSRALSDTSDVTVQVYYDHTSQEDRVIEEDRDTFDIDFQHRFELPFSQEIIWGLNYRITHDEIDDTEVVEFGGSTPSVNLISLFVQDDISLLDDRLRLTVGSKFDYNDLTGFEVQPSARLLWKPHERHRVWAAVSRAVRTPSRGEDDATVFFQTIAGAPPTKVVLQGNRDYDSEDLLAVELGYRGRVHDRISVDVAAFYNRYDDLRTTTLGTAVAVPGPPLHVLQPALFDNDAEADTFGAEVAVNWEVTDWWLLSGSYTWLEIDVHLDSGSTDILAEVQEDQSPNHQFSLRSSMDLPENLELDMALHYVDHLRDGTLFDVSSYFGFDVRLGWRPLGDDRMDLSVVVRNILESHHLEFGRELQEVPTEVQRSVHAVLTFRF